MFRYYLKLNRKLSPIYVFLILMMVIGLYFGYSDSPYYIDVAGITAQFWFFLSVLNIIILYKNRKKEGALKGFFQFFFLIPIPFVLTGVVFYLFMI